MKGQKNVKKEREFSAHWISVVHWKLRVLHNYKCSWNHMQPMKCAFSVIDLHPWFQRIELCKSEIPNLLNRGGKHVVGIFTKWLQVISACNHWLLPIISDISFPEGKFVGCMLSNFLLDFLPFFYFSIISAYWFYFYAQVGILLNHPSFPFSKTAVYMGAQRHFGNIKYVWHWCFPFTKWQVLVSLNERKCQERYPWVH